MSYMSTNWIRILPDNTREIWQSKAKDAAPHASDITYGCCDAKTWWAPLTEKSLLDAVASMSGKDPCLCVTVTDRDGVLDAPEIIEDMGDHHSGRPFMARFSWTIGLPWDPPVTVEEEDGVVVIRDRDSREKIATAKAGMTADQAMYEMRMVRY